MEIGQTIHQWPLALYLRSDPLAYPIVESFHLVGLAMLFGSVILVDLRVLGGSRMLPLSQLARHALPWTWGAFAVVAASGVLLFVAHAADLVGSRAFLLKLVLIVLAGINAALFHAGPYARVASWDVGSVAPIRARVMAGVSILLWMGIIVCGRFIAYV